MEDKTKKKELVPVDDNQEVDVVAFNTHACEKVAEAIEKDIVDAQRQNAKLDHVHVMYQFSGNGHKFTHFHDFVFNKNAESDDIKPFADYISDTIEAKMLKNLTAKAQEDTTDEKKD